ncbi:glycosyltransferase family 1 protein, partial [Bacteroides salyersiae]
MKILLLGEFSNLHWTLAEGLRKLGHEVCVVSNGDRWRNYQRDISLTRQSDSILDGIQ